MSPEETAAPAPLCCGLSMDLPNGITVQLYNLNRKCVLMVQKRKLKPCFPCCKDYSDGKRSHFHSGSCSLPPHIISHLKVTSWDLGERGLFIASQSLQGQEPAGQPLTVGTGVGGGVVGTMPHLGFGRALCLEGRERHKATVCAKLQSLKHPA